MAADTEQASGHSVLLGMLCKYGPYPVAKYTEPM